MGIIYGYPGNLYKKFDNLQDAINFYNEHRRCPPNVRTPFPPHDDTPNPPLEYNPQYDVVHIDYDETSYDREVNVPPYIVVAPAAVDTAAFYPVRQLSQQIVHTV